MTKFLLIFLLASVTSMAQQINITQPVSFLALGDSYTIGESVLVKDRWPVQLVTSLRNQGVDAADPTIIATTGWRTDDLKNAIERATLKPRYSLVSLLIGVNNYYQGKSATDYEPEFTALLEKAITLAGGVKSHVFVVSIPDYGYTPFGKSNQPTISAGIDAFNEVNRRVAETMGVTYIYITDISRRGLREPELVAADGLHPSGKMYAAWVARILEHANVLPKDDDQGTVTGTGEERHGVRIHPNPFTDVINIENVLPGTAVVQLVSASGQSVDAAANRHGNTLTLSTQHVPAGAYVLSLYAGEQTILQQKLVKY